MPMEPLPAHSKHRAFNVSYDEIAYDLISPVSVLPGSADGIPPNSTASAVEVMALWDTGATVSCIKPQLRERLNLPVVQEQGPKVITGVGGVIEVYTTIVNIRLTRNLEIEYCPVSVADFPGNEDILIGMDIITMGDFAVSNTGGKTSFSFAMPPFPDRMNLAEKAEVTNRQNGV